MGSQKDSGSPPSAAAPLSSRNVQARGTMALAFGKPVACGKVQSLWNHTTLGGGGGIEGPKCPGFTDYLGDIDTHLSEPQFPVWLSGDEKSYFTVSSCV